MLIIITRTLIIYFSLLAAMRLLGKRQLGEMELTEFVVAATIADLAANPLQDLGIPLLNGLLPIVILFCCEVLLIWVSGKSAGIRKLLFGKPSILIENGEINIAELEKNRFSNEELMEQLRNKDCLDIKSVQYAILETDGRVNVILKAGDSPATASQTGTYVSEKEYPHIIISSGKLMTENLSLLGFDKAWLDAQITCDMSDIYLMTATEKGKVNIFKERDKNEKT